MGEETRQKPRRAWTPSVRRVVRAIHRDAGYLAVGLTFVYAASGIAVNHIEDWDPSFSNYERRHEVAEIPNEPQRAARHVLDHLGIEDAPLDVYETSPGFLDIALGERTLHVDIERGTVIDEGREPRALLRVANWLHLNRGKKAWTLIADLYAAGLLLLAITGLFMLPGRSGVLGRRGLLVVAGAAIPILYVHLSGGP